MIRPILRGFAWVGAGLWLTLAPALAGDLTQAGGHDEWVDVDDYIRAIKICAKIIVDWSN